jgi:hypothetical protein
MDVRRAVRRAAIVVVITAAGMWACRTGDSQPSSPPVAQAVPVSQPEPSLSRAIAFTPPPAAYAGELPPLPFSPYPPARPPDVVRAVYSFAARHPEVLHYVPCFCGCQNAGHHDNDDCFIKSRDTTGRPTWEPHGMT